MNEKKVLADLLRFLYQKGRNYALSEMHDHAYEYLSLSEEYAAQTDKELSLNSSKEIISMYVLAPQAGKDLSAKECERAKKSVINIIENADSHDALFQINRVAKIFDREEMFHLYSLEAKKLSGRGISPAHIITALRMNQYYGRRDEKVYYVEPEVLLPYCYEFRNEPEIARFIMEFFLGTTYAFSGLKNRHLLSPQLAVYLYEHVRKIGEREAKRYIEDVTSSAVCPAREEFAGYIDIENRKAHLEL